MPVAGAGCATCTGVVTAPPLLHGHAIPADVASNASESPARAPPPPPPPPPPPTPPPASIRATRTGGQRRRRGPARHQGGEHRLFRTRCALDVCSPHPPRVQSVARASLVTPPTPHAPRTSHDSATPPPSTRWGRPALTRWLSVRPPPPPRVPGASADRSSFRVPPAEHHLGGRHMSRVALCHRCCGPGCHSRGSQPPPTVDWGSYDTHGGDSPRHTLLYPLLACRAGHPRAPRVRQGPLHDPTHPPRGLPWPHPNRPGPRGLVVPRTLTRGPRIISGTVGLGDDSGATRERPGRTAPRRGAPPCCDWRVVGLAGETPTRPAPQTANPPPPPPPPPPPTLPPRPRPFAAAAGHHR